ADQRQARAPLAQAHRDQQVAVDLAQDIAPHNPEVGHAVLDVHRDVPVLEREDLDPLLRELHEEAAAAEVQPGEEAGGAEGGEGHLQVSSLGESQANHRASSFSERGAPASSRRSTLSEKPTAGTSAPSR